MDSRQQNLLRSIPSVEELSRHERIQLLSGFLDRTIVVSLIRDATAALRRNIKSGRVTSVNTDELVAEVLIEALNLRRASTCRVINATGSVIDSKLGRSTLAQQAADAVSQVALGYTINPHTSSSTSQTRATHCEQLVRKIVGAEAALITNSEASATLLILSEFARNRDAVVSRGHLIDVGLGFSLADLINASGATLVEVGSSNRTRLEDYRRAVNARTSLIMHVQHASFSLPEGNETVSVRDLHALAAQENARRREQAHRPAQKGFRDELIIYSAQQSGSLVPLECDKDLHSPTVAGLLRQGCNLVSFPSDRLLGGPRSGIIVGNRRLVERLRNNVLLTAIKADKMCLAALEATLQLYLDGGNALHDIPTYRFLTTGSAELAERAERLRQIIAAHVTADQAELSIVHEKTPIDPSLAGLNRLDTYTVRLRLNQGTPFSCREFLASQSLVPIIVALREGQVVLDMRTLDDENAYEVIAKSLARYFASLAHKHA